MTRRVLRLVFAGPVYLVAALAITAVSPMMVMFAWLFGMPAREMWSSLGALGRDAARELWFGAAE